MAAILDFARTSEISWTVPDFLGWFMSGFADMTIISVPEWQAKRPKRRIRGDALSGPAHAKVVSRYPEDYLDASMSRESAEAI